MTKAIWNSAGPHRPALRHARQLHLNCPYSEESWSDVLQAQVRPHVDRVLAEIDRLYTRTSSGPPVFGGHHKAHLGQVQTD
ncbi:MULTISPECIES: hypothetical protein [unclassified Streptomyces]|uniref:hypothetical protein n=1 Tax=unclassified Streptomyces TaxID=2593676 RepID=UPI0034207BBD